MPDGYGLVMPFVVVVSNGGPFDDQSFVAGWRCAEIDRYLHACEHTAARLSFNVEEAVIPQLDLIAMHRGYVMEQDEGGAEHGWIPVTFEKASDREGEVTE